MRTNIQQGFSLLIVVIAIGLTCVLFSVSLVVQSVGSITTMTASNAYEQAQSLATSCIELALESHRRDQTYLGGILTVATQTCQIQIDTIGGQIQVKVTSTVDQVYARQQAVISGLQPVIIESWTRY